VGTIHFGTSDSIFHERNVTGQHNNRNTSLSYRDAYSPFKNLRELPRTGNELDVVAAILEQAFRMSCLKIVDPDLTGGDVRGDSQNRNAAALAIEQAIDQMQVAWTAAASANCKASGQMSFGACREGGGLFMAHVDPVN
jgi:hypothetical protein